MTSAKWQNRPLHALTPSQKHQHMAETVRTNIFSTLENSQRFIVTRKTLNFLNRQFENVMKVLWHFYLPLPNSQPYVLAVLKQFQPVSHYGNRLVPSSRWCRSVIIYTLFCASVLICPRASWKNDVRHSFLFQQIGNTGWKSWQKLLKSAARWTHKWMMSETKDNWPKYTVDTHEAQ